MDSGRIYCSIKCAVDGGVQFFGVQTKAKNGTITGGINSYSRAKRGWREVGGQRVFFRSRMEANYARYLTHIGEQWKYEPKTFWFHGLKRGAVSYTPDFFIPRTNSYVETKGWMDEKSKTKLKRMSKYHPDVTLVVVNWESYRAIERVFSKIIPEWEISS